MNLMLAVHVNTTAADVTSSSFLLVSDWKILGAVQAAPIHHSALSEKEAKLDCSYFFDVAR